MKRWFASLVNRAVAFVILAIVLAALAVALVSSMVARSELEAQAREQVETIADLVAGELDARLSQRRDTLAHVAEGFAMEENVLTSRARVLIRREIALQHLFDGVYLFDTEGTVIAEHPQQYQQTGLNVSEREYFQQTSNQLTPVISEPYVSNYKDRPAIMITAPIFDHRQRFIGVLGGAVMLTGDNFMEEISTVRIGRTGYVGIATRSGITLAHGRTGETMTPLRLENPVLRDAMSGFEGTLSATNQEGTNTIMSVRQMSQAPWFVAAVWPADEAYAPVSRLTDSFVQLLLIVILVTAPLALLVFRRLMKPLRNLGFQISERHLGIRTEPVDVAGGSEIRQVAETFNTVMEERDEVMASLAEREAFFRSLTQSAPIGIIQTDVLGRIEFVNPAFEQIVGTDSNDLLHTPLLEGVYEEDRVSAVGDWNRALRENTVFLGRFRLKTRKDQQQLVWADVMTAVIGTDERTLGTITVVRDITHELEIEAELAEEQERADSILGVLKEGVLMLDNGGFIRYANEAACGFLGLPHGCEQANFFERVSIENENRRWELDDFLRSADVDSLYATMKNSRGRAFDVDLAMLHLRRGSDHHRLVLVIRDDSQRRREEERLSWEATHDSLTGLLNRRAFNSSLVKCLGDADKKTVASVLMLIDLDYFKPVNDEGGHLMGDDLLGRISDLLKASVRQSDTVARLGGDEFGIILPACGLDRAVELAETIRRGIEGIRIEQDGKTFGVTASLGLTEMSGADSGPREVMARADEGTYAAKAQGRNQVVTVPLPPEGRLV
ncbi:diguanylate cyclase [Marinobacter sp. TBZ242]|uniref:Diguanylate cyclase n=1 Tax=Marinobacter azerbaijanicus TaxID=3050455 RepID=A0ABT7IGN0_9GAMM|nr:diguanylate cyclase [Marinobacter sp. TBZ242]MDL0432840.1 diguanylate cyclase [Marinobacter sp. TBZ242]